MRRSFALMAAAFLFAACSGGNGGGAEDSDAATPGEETFEGRPAGYVALGDSFSSGAGAPPYGTPNNCYRSERSWPHLLAAELGADVTLVELRACGGARVEHLLAPWSRTGEPAQIPGDADRGVGLVTFTIGGNDIGFGAIVNACVLTDCFDELHDSPKLMAKLDAVRTRLVADVYPLMRAAYPEALLVHVGYPSLTPAVGDPLGSCSWFSAEEHVAIAGIMRSLDELGAGAADEASTAMDDDAIRFVSVLDAFADHELCTADPWVHEVVSLNASRGHPTVDGYRALASAVADEL